MSRIKDKFVGDRPREKMAQKGVRALSNNELAQVLIGSGGKGNDVVKIAARLNRILRKKKVDVTLDELREIPGVNTAHATRILAAFELASRYGDAKTDKILSAPNKVLPLLSDIRDKQQEYFVVLTLDGANRLICKYVITIGTLTASLVHPREVFAPAIADRAAGVIVAHNHPSGSLESSVADREVTERLKRAGELLGISLVDHIIVTKDAHRSII